MLDYIHWHELLVNFAKKIGKPDPEEYINDGGWKARQGGNGLEAAQTSVVSFEPCATEEKAFNYELQRPITEVGERVSEYIGQVWDFRCVWENVTESGILCDSGGTGGLRNLEI